MKNSDRIALDMMKKLGEEALVNSGPGPDLDPSTPEVEQQGDMVDKGFIDQMAQKFPQKLINIDFETFWKRSIAFIEQILRKNIWPRPNMMRLKQN